jgi:hypothetical protein
MGQLLREFQEAGVGAIGLKQLREQREIISKRWSDMGLLEGLSGNVKENCAQLFENQLTHMLTESTESASSGSYETVAFPIVRRVFSKLLANEIVSVQALNLPIGKLFFINPKISTRSAAGAHTSPDGAYENAATQASRTGFETLSLYDSYYAKSYDDEGTSLFDRSKGAITTVSGTGVVTTGTLGTDQVLDLTLSGFTLTSQGKLVGPVGVPVDTESFLASLKIVATNTLRSTGSSETIAVGSPIQYSVKVQPYGKAIVNPTTGHIVLKLQVNAPGSVGVGGYVPLNGGTGSTNFLFSYATYRDLEEDSEMAEVNFTLDEVTVSVETRKMRAQWTPELAQDVSAFHNIDAEAELTALLSEQMAAEIDREILRDLRRGAAWTARWDYNGLRTQVATYYGTQKDYNQTLITKINQISAQIHKSTLRGGASWLVVSAEVSAVLDDLEYFHVSNAAPDQDKYNMGIEKVGVLSGRYQVYRDPYAPANTILIGHRGDSILASGYIFAPYIPLTLTPVMYNPFDFKPIRGVYQRSAKKFIMNRFYGKVIVDGLTTFGIGDLV